jgi:peptidoglycan/xylan/chitin deacetylase (PgdA/CDA1 family)
MERTNFSTNPALKGISTPLKRFANSLKNRKSISKRKHFILTATMLSVVLSYNSCGIHYPILLDNKNAETLMAADNLKTGTNRIVANNQKTIYLTFDDGPNRGTSKVMGVLEKAEAPATFFLVGSHIHGSDKQWSEYEAILSNPSLEAANHTYFHAKNQYDRFYKNTDIALKDFRLMRDSLRLNCPVGRTPGCNTWRTTHIVDDVDRRSRQAADLLQSNGFTLVGWDVEWKATGKRELKKTPTELLAEIDQAFAERQTHTDDHLVLLLHDQHFVDSSNVRALEELIELLKNDYNLEKVSGYPCL